MQSSKETKKTNRGHFAWLYKVLCQDKQVKPLPAVQAYLNEECLRFCVDRLALKDWSPILNSIAENRSLWKIYIYSRGRNAWTSKVWAERVEKRKGRRGEWVKRGGGRDPAWPILYTNFLLRCLVDSVAVFTRDSTSITSITLDGIPLAPKYLSILCTGLQSNRRLMTLSLTGCRIGDIGCDLLLGCLRNNPSLCVLDLSSCRLTNRSASSLSLFLKRRKADVMQNVWEKSSSQSQEERCDKKPQGLHTLILNGNLKIRDIGVRQLMQALKADIWLKSLSLKHCGITKHGAEVIIELLQSNSVITTMDLTENHIPINTLQDVLRILKRRRELGESNATKKKFILKWREASSVGLRKRDETNAPGPEGARRSIDQSKKHSRSSSQSCRQRRVQRFKERRCKQPNETRGVKKEGAVKRSNLCDLESQLVDIISSNSKLKEELSSNKALLDAEVQERSRTEDEMQTVSLQLNDLRCRVIMHNCLRSKMCGESQLLDGLRNVYEKLEAFSVCNKLDVNGSEVDVALGDTAPRSMLFAQQGGDIPASFLEESSCCP